MTAYYNEIDAYAAQWLRNLIVGGHIAPGDVDERSIVDVHADDLAGYTQCHFFAGIGGWSLAARMAGWPDDRPIWTGSCPCQPFSSAGRGLGTADERHLWPAFFDLIRACRPAVVMGEQVAAAVGKSWLDGVCADLEGIGYAVGAAVVPACAVDAPHRRDRLWFVADSDSERGQINSDAGGCEQGSFAGQEPRPVSARNGALADSAGDGWEQGVAATKAARYGRKPAAEGGGAWSGAEWLAGADGKARRVGTGIRLLAHGVPCRVGQLRAFGNAIVPQVAAEVIGAYLEARP